MELTPERIMLIGNIVLVSFCAGKLWQKVNDLCRRVGALEKKLSGNNPKAEGDKGE